MKRSAAEWLGLQGNALIPARRRGSEGSGGLIRHPAMDEWVRRVCAVYADGRCLIAEGYESDRNTGADGSYRNGDSGPTR